MSKLPFAISVPHGGIEVPDEFAGYIMATPDCMAEDVDHLTREICWVEPARIAHLLTFSVSRTFVDLNRPPYAVGEQFPDGVVKRRTHLGRQVFREFPPDGVVQAVMNRLYHPYHARLEEVVADPEVKLTIDCHSMAPRGLPVSPDAPGKERPPICLGYKGGKSATREMVMAMREVMADVYELSPRDIWIDKPFNGGYITATYGTRSTPVIQVEFSRGFYMETEVGKPDPNLPPADLELWQGRFVESLERLAKKAIFR